MTSRSIAPVYPPVAVQMRRRWWIRLSIFTALTLAAAAVLLDHLGCFGYRGDDVARFDRRAVVVTGVADACTVTIRRTDGGHETTVHLLGTDAPPAGVAAESKAYTASRLLGKGVTLRLDALQPRDAAGNLLAFLYLTDADVFNVDLVREGFAWSDRRVNHLLRTSMDGAESDARKHHQGLWRDEAHAAMPAWRLQWLQGLRERHIAAE